jgi:uncharacterized membrane protein
MLIPFPIAFLVGALGADIAYLATRQPFWAQAAMWLLAAGLVTGGLAAVLGGVDFITIRQARNRTGWFHFIGNAAALLFALMNLILRTRDMEGGIASWGISLSVLVTVILIFTGWLGGELAYRYKIGVIGEEAKDEKGSVGLDSDRPVVAAGRR